MPSSASSRDTEGKMGPECSAWVAAGGFGADSGSEGGEDRGGSDFFDGSGAAAAASCFGSSFDSSLGVSKLDISSPSSASKAITFPTSTFLVPSGAYRKGQLTDILQDHEAEAPVFSPLHRHLELQRLWWPCPFPGLTRHEVSIASCKYMIANVNTRTISSRTSPTAKASPSFFFHDEIPPSVMVGDIAGI